MKYISLECGYCMAMYNIEYDDSVVMDDRPIYCPFCSEIIEEEFDDEDDEDKVEDE